jgi:hypothetical protein
MVDVYHKQCRVVERYRKALEEIRAGIQGTENLLDAHPDAIPFPNPISASWYKIKDIAKKALEEG